MNGSETMPSEEATLRRVPFPRLSVLHGGEKKLDRLNPEIKTLRSRSCLLPYRSSRSIGAPLAVLA